MCATCGLYVLYFSVLFYTLFFHIQPFLLIHSPNPEKRDFPGIVQYLTMIYSPIIIAVWVQYCSDCGKADNTSQPPDI